MEVFKLSYGYAMFKVFAVFSNESIRIWCAHVHPFSPVNKN